MKMYETYKTSDLPWIKRFPYHWKNIRNGALFDYHHDKVGSAFAEYDLLSLTTQGVRRKDINDVTGKVPASYSGYQEVKNGDMIFCLFDLDCSAVFSGLSHHSGMITSAYDVATPIITKVNPRYMEYWFQSVFAGRYYKIFSKSVRYTINWDVFKAIKSPVPPRPEQNQIVRYLDWKVSCINRLIHGYQRQIELLKERRMTIIDNAVTKGIHPDVPMKRIDGNWMGEIPAHWEMVPAKRLFVEGKERKYPSDEPATASQKYGIILQKDFVEREGRRIVIATQGLDNWKHVRPDDFVISLRSFQGGIERSKITGCVTWHYVVLLPQEQVCPEYFQWLLKSKSYIKALQGTSDFIRDGQDLRFSNFVKVDLPQLSIQEQEEIADYIKAETQGIDNAIPRIDQQVSLLREYRTRLISDVVTGQIDVRDEVIPDYTPETDTEDEDAAESEVG
ncbi:MAG: hypothetical protein LUD69_03330 [Oscillospiraceae bacterium]|nr:hypothetical protein [Oscillospiraceae bacterium]